MKKKLTLIAILVVTFVIYMAINALDYSPFVLLSAFVIVPIDTIAVLWYFSE